MKRIRKSTLLILAIFLAVVPARFIKAQESVKKPNVVFILADDLGFMDVAFNGSKFYETPNLDKQGMVFRNAYDASPLCSPTRASILTGHHPATIGITFPDCHLPEEILIKGLDTTRNTCGDWKLIRFYCDNPDQSDRYELYNVKSDIGEKINLLDKNQGKAKELKKLINNILIETAAVVPVPNLNYKSIVNRN